MIFTYLNFFEVLFVYLKIYQIHDKSDWLFNSAECDDAYFRVIVEFFFSFDGCDIVLSQIHLVFQIFTRICCLFN